MQKFSATPSRSAGVTGRKRGREDEEQDGRQANKRARTSNQGSAAQVRTMSGNHSMTRQALEPLFEMWRKNRDWELEVRFLRPAVTGDQLNNICTALAHDSAIWKRVGGVELSVDFCHRQRPTETKVWRLFVLDSHSPQGSCTSCTSDTLGHATDQGRGVLDPV